MQHSTRSEPADDVFVPGSGHGLISRRRAAERRDNGDNGRSRRPRPTAAELREDNQDRIEYAKLAMEEMVIDAICNGRTGTISVEIPVKEGRLGRVKRLRVEYQPD